MKSIEDRLYGLVVVLIIGLISVASCTNDHALDAMEYGKVYMPQAREYPYEVELQDTDSVQTLYYSAKLGGPRSTANSRTPVSFDIDSALVDSFNVENNTSFQILPAESYTIGELEQVIEVGEEQSESSTIEIIAQSNLERGVKYLLPVKMNVEGGDLSINENLQTTYYLVGIPPEDQEEEEELPIYDRSNWSIHDFSSEDAPQQPASNVLDGDPGTLWQGAFRGVPNEPLPHHVSINMGQTYKVHGVFIHPKNANEKSMPSKIEVEFSSDGQNWRDSQIYNEPWSYDNYENRRLYLSSPVEAQYIRVTILEDYGDVPVTGLGEVYAFGELPIQDRSNWTIHDFSSEDVEQPASNVLDGDAGTLWQGAFRGVPNEPLPHSVSINMGKP